MLELKIDGSELWDEVNQEFITIKERTLVLEHSLVSISKWETIWCKPFLSKTNDLTGEELKSYVQCMTITQNVDPIIYNCLSNENIEKIREYIEAPMTATTFSEDIGKNKTINHETITSELVYYWMVALQIPFECQRWPLNRLLTLIRICNIKNQAPKKHSRADIMRRNAELNAARRKQLHTKG